VAADRWETASYFDAQKHRGPPPSLVYPTVRFFSFRLLVFHLLARRARRFFRTRCLAFFLADLPVGDAGTGPVVTSALTVHRGLIRLSGRPSFFYPDEHSIRSVVSPQFGFSIFMLYTASPAGGVAFAGNRNVTRSFTQAHIAGHSRGPGAPGLP